MLPYAAYLRVYEPVSAFPEPARTLWTVYADSRRRPRRIHALDVEHLQARHRLVASPPVVAPERESGDAYVRRDGGTVYICPWETRLRSWLAFARFRERTPERLSASFVPPAVSAGVEETFARWKLAGRSLHPHIAGSTWHVPLTWFVLFAAAERCLVLDAPDGGGHGPATATRTLTYVTSMAEARRRVEAALPVVRDGVAGTGSRAGPSAGRLDTLGRWLEAFHPGALVELDYGGLVHLLDDPALRADESVAEVGVALAALARGETELAVAMYQRLHARWRPVRALESAS